MNWKLSDTVKSVVLHTGSTAGTSTVNSSSVDMAGFSAARFFAYFGTPAANNTIKIQQSADNGVADSWSDIAGTQVAAGSPDNLVVMDIKDITERYLRVVALRGTSTVLGEIHAELYDGRYPPATTPWRCGSAALMRRSLTSRSTFA
jgi:hypothetical protein